MKKKKIRSRREFIKQSAIGLAGFTIVPRYVLGGRGYRAPSDTLYIAAVGIGGKGASDIDGFFKSGKAKMAFLCDVDELRGAETFKKFPDAKKYADWRELFDKEASNFDAVSVSTPDHSHAVIGTAAITMGKHIWIQKPLTHTIEEARLLARLAKEHKVVSQMGNQGSSNDGTRLLREWYEAGLIGDIEEVYCWTNRPIWPQGLKWPEKTAPVPSTLNWDVWQGPRDSRPYPADDPDQRFGVVVPFNWRGWWEYGTGAIGDMGAHLIEAPMNVLGLREVTGVESSVSTLYTNKESGPVATTSTLTFAPTEATHGKSIKLHWSDGGIIPPRPDEIGPDETWPTNGILFYGSKGKMMAETYSGHARLLPESRMEGLNVPVKYPRVEGGANGHYAQWVEACLAGYGNMEVSSPFEKAALLTEFMLIANLSVRSFTEGIEAPPSQANGNSGFGNGNRPRIVYPTRGKKLLWDAKNMKVTNIDIANKFIKDSYRDGFKLSGI